jgi:molybdopterin molybdotransferase
MSASWVTVQEAQRLVFEWTREAAVRDKSSAGVEPEFLAEDLIADRDFPPFDRVAMDGIAIKHEAWQLGINTFLISGMQAAGEPAKSLNRKYDCIEVMTGAMLPFEADTVIPYEQIKITAHNAQILANKVLPWQNVHRRGCDHRQGDTVVEKGSFLSPPEWAVAASIGKQTLKIFGRPSISVIVTGSELVDVNATPEPFQIRRSNDSSIIASLRYHHFSDIKRFYCKDDWEETLATVRRALETSEVLIFTGGVSMGKFDILPGVFRECGVTEIFHRIKQKPGKPMFFGVSEKGQTIFGLPGNPTSSLISFHRFVLPALFHSIDRSRQFKRLLYVKLSEDIEVASDLTCFRPARLRSGTDGELWADLLAWSSSGDVAGLCQSDGFVEIEAGYRSIRRGGAVPLWLWRHFI